MKDKEINELFGHKDFSKELEEYSKERKYTKKEKDQMRDTRKFQKANMKKLDKLSYKEREFYFTSIRKEYGEGLGKILESIMRDAYKKYKKKK